MAGTHIYVLRTQYLTKGVGRRRSPEASLFRGVAPKGHFYEPEIASRSHISIIFQHEARVILRAPDIFSASVRKGGRQGPFLT